MQTEARQQMEARGLKNIDLVKAIGMSEGAIGRALSAKQPAANTPTLRAIFNHLFPSPATQDLKVHANALAQRSPETAALLSAVFREIADLLTHPVANSGRPRSS